MTVDLTVVASPDPATREAILRPLLAFNDSRAGPSGYAPVAIAIRDPATGATSGGLWAGSLYDWLYVEILFVPEAMRGRGLGARLLRMAESIAGQRGCVGVWVDTFGFQARGFYEKLGYEVFGTLDDHPRGSHRFFLRRRLAAIPSPGGA